MSPTGGSLAAVRIQVSTTATSPPTRPRSACCSGPASACCPRRAGCHEPDATSSWSSTRSTARRTRSTGSPGSPRASAPSTPRGRSRRWSSTSHGGALRGGARRRRDAERRADLTVVSDSPRRLDRRAVRVPAAPPRLEAVPGARGRRARPVRRRGRRARRATSTAAATRTVRGTTSAACSSATRPARCRRRVRPRPRRARPRGAAHSRRRLPHRCCSVRASRPGVLSTEPARRLDPLIRRIHSFLLSIYRRLPRRARIAVVHTLAPTFTVGAMCVIERPDGAVLLVRHAYRHRWGLPGGLLGRGEDARVAARREALEEVGVRIEILGEPAVVVDPRPRRVDVVYRARARERDGSRRRPADLGRDRRGEVVPERGAPRAAARDRRRDGRARACEAAGQPRRRAGAVIGSPHPIVDSVMRAVHGWRSFVSAFASI